MRGDSYQLQGQQGGKVISSTDGAVSGAFREIRVLSDTVFVSLTGNLTDATARLAGVTVPGGVVIGGRFSGIEVASGVVAAYAD